MPWVRLERPVLSSSHTHPNLPDSGFTLRFQPEPQPETQFSAFVANRYNLHHSPILACTKQQKGVLRPTWGVFPIYTRK